MIQDPETGSGEVTCPITRTHLLGRREDREARQSDLTALVLVTMFQVILGLREH